MGGRINGRPAFSRCVLRARVAVDLGTVPANRRSPIFLQGCFVPDAAFYLPSAACPAAEKRPKASACIGAWGLGFRAFVGQKGGQFAPFLAFKAAGLGFGVQSAAQILYLVRKLLALPLPLVGY